ncbi:MAG TPA: zinc-dependent peptidase [Flavobacteriales bacterium]|jgi:Mlc titration factor MtfA (ptsG expression regulator)|nr:zinc-dependent peptidase [Flavobacteriales bacterium]
MSDIWHVLSVILVVLIPMALMVLGAARWAGYLRGPASLSPSHRRMLEKYALPYQRTASKDRPRFEHIVAQFIADKEWQGAGIGVAEEMKVLVAATAAQLLFGFDDVRLDHFERIILHPDSYRSGRKGTLHQGEVRPTAGVIMVSWGDLLRGYGNPRDGHNVGLHELAHALWFEHKLSEDKAPFLHPELLQRWIDHADGEIERIRNGRSRLFREYAGTNQAEFFAVAVEYFFERPGEFNAELPELYAVLCGMLNQFPDKASLS